MEDINKTLENLERINLFDFTFKQTKKNSIKCCMFVAIISLITFLCASFKYVFFSYENDKIYYLIVAFSVFGTYFFPYFSHYFFLKKYFSKVEKFKYEKELLFDNDFKSNCYYFMMESSDHIVYICAPIVEFIYLTIYLYTFFL